jgi:hypothetical protein
MRYICDAPGDKTWFGIETEAEAEAESVLMSHAVARYYKRARAEAIACYTPAPSTPAIERDIGLKGHIERTMPRFATLRDGEGAGLATAMLPPEGVRAADFRIIVVGPENADPYDDHADAIAALGKRFGFPLPRERCYPYRR